MRPSLTAQIGVAAGGLTAALLPPIVGDAALVETAMPPPYVTLQEQNFRTEIDGKPVDLYTIRNPAGMEVRITNYGARIEQILVPDRHGRLGDVVQGYETIDQVRSGQSSMGAFIGRYANRIAGGRFTLEGKEHQLTLNSGPHSSHGGTKGSRFQVFDATQLSPSSVEMTYTFADGEEGYPGTLPLRVVYSVTDDNALAIDYTAVAVDKPTVINLTSHAFFNLSGSLGQPVLDHVVTINADKVLEVDDSLIPTGKLRDVAGTPMDFRAPATIGSRIDQDYDMLKRGRGYDHAYAINRSAEAGAQLAATVHEPVSGRVMEVWSTEPSVQFFTANSLTGKGPRDVGKGNTPYIARSAFCIEPQHFPDSPNHPEFPSTVLKRGAWYNGQIIYRFSTRS
jgi:aldose 1-epimerase